MRSLLLLSIVFIACNSNNNEPGKDPAAYFSAISKNDMPLDSPQAGDWRSIYQEPEQNFAAYKNAAPKKATAGMKIYLLPIGHFKGEQNRLLELTKEYVEIYFQLPAVLMNPVSDSIIPDTSKRLRGADNMQLHTRYIMDSMLKGKIPGNGYALMAISEKDLYPSPDWNFVFGIASYKHRVGLSSIYRLYNGELNAANFSLCLTRLINTATHELGHMFSISHCVSFKCCMNGSNSLSESDNIPERLCSVCQQKLHWNIGYDNKKRLAELIKYFKENNLEEDWQMAGKDLERVED